MIVMNAETEPGETIAQGNAAPALRWSRDLAHLWSGWPFGGTWPFRDEPADAAAPIKVEEYVEGEHLVVKAEIPGVDPERDIEVTVDDGVLTITAQRRETVTEKSGQGYRTEFSYGSFLRQIRLPKGAAPDVVSATYRDGVLEIRMPKPEKDAESKRIPIERG
jgi:HSP20 family protein